MLQKLLSCSLIFASTFLFIPGCSQHRINSADANGNTWVDAWAASYLPTKVNGTIQNVPTFNNQTLRLEIFSKLAGTAARVRFTNQFETTPLHIAAAHIALRDHDASILPETDRPLSFHGNPSITILPNEEIWSDPVTLTIPQHADISISIYLPSTRKPTAFHATGLKTSYLSAPGDFTATPTLPPSATTPHTATQIFFANDLQVLAPAKTKTIVCLGDSITDGSTSTIDTNASWPDMLSKRLPSLPDGTPISVINMGIGSNRIVTADAAGPTGLHRFPHDVLARPDVTHLILFEGINDISYEHPKPEQLIAAYQQIITQAHNKKIKVIGVTLLPIQNSRKDTPENEATRQTVNQWIRQSATFDAVLDFEKIIADPANPLRIRSNLTTDYVHPNSAGYKLLADSIDLTLFR